MLKMPRLGDTFSTNKSFQLESASIIGAHIQKLRIISTCQIQPKSNESKQYFGTGGY